MGTTSWWPLKNVKVGKDWDRSLHREKMVYELQWSDMGLPCGGKGGSDVRGPCKDRISSFPCHVLPSGTTCPDDGTTRPDDGTEPVNGQQTI